MKTQHLIVLKKHTVCLFALTVASNFQRKVHLGMSSMLKKSPSKNKTKCTMEPWIYTLMKINKDYNKKTYFLIYPLISLCENLKMLSKNSSYGVLLSY